MLIKASWPCSALCLALWSLSSGCSTTPLDGGNADLAQMPAVPLIHRATAPTCSSDRPAFDCKVPNGPPSTCSLDASCNHGMNGRCVGSRVGCNCSYDTCKTDADCPADHLCDCRNHWNLGAGGPNACIATNCHTDADCGPHGYCSPSLDPGCGAFFGVTGWYCHTAKDTCTNDSECAGKVDGGFGPPFCGYRPEVGHWACSATQCAG